MALLSHFPKRADNGSRTRDLLTTNEVRYLLCHISLTSTILALEIYFVKRFVYHSKLKIITLIGLKIKKLKEVYKSPLLNFSIISCPTLI